MGTILAFTRSWVALSRCPAILLALLCGVLVAQAQPAFKVASEVDRAKALRADWPDASVIRTKSTLTYSFGKAKGGKALVTANERVQESLVALKHNVKYSDGTGYDEQSSVPHFAVRDEKNKPQIITPYRGSYELDGIFHSDAMVFAYQLEFGTEGKMLNVDYTKHYRDVKYLCTAFFREDTPILERELVFEVPDWLELELLEMNFEGKPIERTTKRNATKNGDIITFTWKNVPAYKRDPMSPQRSKNDPHLVILAKKFKDAGSEKVLFASTDDLYTWYKSLVDDMKNDEAVLSSMVSTLTKGKTTDEDKIEAIFYWVQDNVRYIAFEEGIMGFKPEDCQKVYTNRYGDCKGMANLTKEMLKIAGYDARLTWIGTRDIPYDYSIPSLAVDNHMICTVFLGDKVYFLDATEKYIALDDYAHRIQGRPVLIEDGAGYKLMKVPDLEHTRNLVERKDRLTLEGEALVGTSERIYHGEGKTTIMYALGNVRSDERNEALRNYLRKRDANFVVSNETFSDLEDRGSPLRISHDLVYKNQVTKVGNEVYINVDHDPDLAGLKMENSRQNDIEFDSKVYRRTNVVVALPKGSRIEHLPKPVEVSNEHFRVKLGYEVKGTDVHYSKLIEVPNAYVPLSAKDDWNHTLDRLKEFYKDQLIITTP
jgi:hypothetical protein